MERCFGCKTSPIIKCRHTTDLAFALYDDHDPNEFDVGNDGNLYERIHR